MLAPLNYIYSMVGLLAFFYGISLFVSIISFLWKRPGRLPTPAKEVEDWPYVTVQIPVYNEACVIDRVIEAVSNLDYPRDRLEIHVLDDSTDETSKMSDERANILVSRGYDIHVIRRSERVDYKTGALKEAFAATTGELITVLDADFSPPRDYLKLIVPYFVVRPHLGFVQARWGYFNDQQSMVTMVQAIALDIHFALEKPLEQQAKLFINYNGSGGVWRKEAIRELGGWPTNTLSEDLELSYRAQLAGWQAIYLPDLIVCSELPDLMSVLALQQERWARGAFIVLKKLWREILVANVSLSQRLHALLILVGYAFPSIFIIQLIALSALVLFSSPSFLPALGTIALILVNAVAGVLSQKETYADWSHRIVSVPAFLLVSIGLSLRITLGWLEGLFCQNYTFIRTPKYGFTNQGREAKTNLAVDQRMFSHAGITMIEFSLAIFALVGATVSLLRSAWLIAMLLLVYTAGFLWVSTKTTLERIG